MINCNKLLSLCFPKLTIYAAVILFMISIMSFDNSNAQNVSVSGANAGNGSYATLGAAFIAINGGSQTGANISILISNNTTETATAQLNSGSWNSFSITPSSAGSKTISGNISGNALIRLDGADNVNIIGITGSSLIFNNTSTSAYSTLLFINDACNNRVTNCNIRGVSTNANVFFGTGIATGNDNNVIDNCLIGDFTGSTPAYAVRFEGSASFPNNGDTIRNCLIFNFFSSTAPSAGIRIGTGSSDITIFNNRFFQTSVRIMSAAVTHYVIWIDNLTANNCSIIDNVIGYNASYSLSGPYTVGGSHVSSRFMIIYVNGGSTSIQGNIFTAITFTGIMAGTFAANPFTFIYINWGSANIGNESRNFFGGYFPEDSTYVSTSSAAETHVFGIYMTGMSTDCNTSNNTFRNIRINGGIMGLRLIRRFRTVSYNWVCQNNDIGDTLKANSIVNTSSNTASFTTGIYGTNAGASDVSGNKIRNMSAAGGTVYGINLDASNSQTVSQNTIYNLSNTNTSQTNVMSGIQVTGSGTYEKNFIHSLSASSSSATINGIYATGGPCNIRNNMVRLGITSAGSGLNIGAVINGINEITGSNSFYCNSVYIGGNPTSTANSSYAFKSASVSASRNYINNIFFNARSDSGSTGKHYAIQLATSTGCTSKNNDLLVSGTGGVLGFYGSDRADLTAWKSATLLDTNSISANPKFINPTGNSSNVNLHIDTLDTLTVSPVNGAGINIAGVSTDFDGNIRNASTPDIGADEFYLYIKLNLTMFIEGFYNVSSNLQESDSVKVYLRNSISPYGIVDSTRAVVSDSGKVALTFINASNGTYYIVITHRNSIEIWSKNGITMSQGNIVSYNFSSAAAQVFGDNVTQVDSSPLRFALYSGDLNQDGTIDSGDLSGVENDAANSVTGYVPADLNGDDFVDGSDLSLVENNAALGVSVVSP